MSSSGGAKTPGIDLAFGAEIEALRLQQGLSFEELSRRSGISRTYLQDIAHGRRGHSWPSASIVDRVAAAFGVDPDHFTITKARAVLSERQVLDVAYGKVQSVRRLRAKKQAAGKEAA